MKLALHIAQHKRFVPYGTHPCLPSAQAGKFSLRKNFFYAETLKAIGKSINIRVSSFAASKIPIIIIGNTPITKSYYEKVDHLKRNGIIRGFWSINPKPLDSNGENIKTTPYKGFYRFDEYKELEQRALNLLKEEREFFSSMQTRRGLGEIIEIANKETTYEAKARKFLELLRQSKE